MERWARQSDFTDPGAARLALAALGDEPARIVEAIQGLMIHGEALTQYGLEAQAFSRETLPAAARLAAMLAADERPLELARAPVARALGTCRDYAVLLCSALRAQGLAARVRCGFASYFGDGGAWEDHWVCELWSEGRWRRMDAQLDDVLRPALGVAFDPLDLPQAAYQTADEAWRACRAGGADPGVFGHGEARGLWFVYVDLVRDRLALADRMTSDWDGWRAVVGAPELSDEVLGSGDRMVAVAEGVAPEVRPWWPAAS